ncbi:hypothetical protein NEF87_002361 [Candidatus Lokiarchaeum ossiferum]|uniref:Histidine kinase N-terminal 7TM region domain-containing protein n=1 Tax=Candidatus Lokiarchaeum ossiferum TaxID=2951803 RepID=A0ABY6HRE3_9ARCH|nr:hypothetical protein NEF87_002361 [Candidatus Lokiarchaeum sp. B-35]
MAQIFWTLGVIISFSAALFILLCVLFTLNHYRKTHYKHLLYYAIMWVFWFIWEVFQAISDLFLSVKLHLICFYALIGVGYFTILYVDVITLETHDIRKFVVLTAIVMLVIVFSFDENAVIIDYDGIQPYPTMHGRFRVANLMLMAFIISLLLFSNVNLLRRSPKHLLHHSRNNLFGFIMYGILPYIIQYTKLEKIVPGIANSAIAIGVIIATYTLINTPQLAFILPFTLERLLIIDSHNGMSIFTHEFNDKGKEFPEAIFSGFMKATGNLFDYTLNRGKVRQIILENATLLVKSSSTTPLFAVIITDKASPSLIKSLDAFTKKLFSDHRITGNYVYSTVLNDYFFIKDYVEDYFSFVP